MSYRQKMSSLDSRLRQARERDDQEKREANRRMSLSASECYSEGWDRGVEDVLEEYAGALDHIWTLGDGYAYPQSYRNGYTAAWEKG